MRKILHLSPTQFSRLVLHIELPLILLQAVIFLVTYLIAREESPAQAYLVYSPLATHLLTPMMLSFFSALLIKNLK